MGYTKYAYQVKPLGKDAYYPRADDPTKIIVKAYKDAMQAAQTWRLEAVRALYTRNPQARPCLVSAGSKSGYNKIYGAAVLTPEMAEDLPTGDNESDLKALAILDKEWQDRWTHENTVNRIQTLLAMLGDVEVEKSPVNIWRYSKQHQTVFKVKGQTLILIGEV